MADALHQFARGARGQLVQRGIARGALTDARSDFDQFVIGQRAVQLAYDAFAEACVAEHDYGIQGMCQAPQVFLLFLG